MCYVGLRAVRHCNPYYAALWGKGRNSESHGPSGAGTTAKPHKHGLGGESKLSVRGLRHCFRPLDPLNMLIQITVD